jgi:hypothetical protein
MTDIFLSPYLIAGFGECPILSPLEGLRADSRPIRGRKSGSGADDRGYDAELPRRSTLKNASSLNTIDERASITHRKNG